MSISVYVHREQRKNRSQISYVYTYLASKADSNSEKTCASPLEPPEVAESEQAVATVCAVTSAITAALADRDAVSEKSCDVKIFAFVSANLSFCFSFRAGERTERGLASEGLV